MQQLQLFSCLWHVYIQTATCACVCVSVLEGRCHPCKTMEPHLPVAKIRLYPLCHCRHLKLEQTKKYTTVCVFSNTQNPTRLVLNKTVSMLNTHTLQYCTMLLAFPQRCRCCVQSLGGASLFIFRTAACSFRLTSVLNNLLSPDWLKQKCE